MFHKKCCLQTSFVGIKSHKLAWCPSVKAVFVIPLHHVDAYLHHVDVQMVIIIELFAFFSVEGGVQNPMAYLLAGAPCYAFSRKFIFF